MMKMTKLIFLMNFLTLFFACNQSLDDKSLARKKAINDMKAEDYVVIRGASVTSLINTQNSRPLSVGNMAAGNAIIAPFSSEGFGLTSDSQQYESSVNCNGGDTSGISLQSIFIRKEVIKDKFKDHFHFGSQYDFTPDGTSFQTFKNEKYLIGVDGNGLTGMQDLYGKNGCEVGSASFDGTLTSVKYKYPSKRDTIDQNSGCWITVTLLISGDELSHFDCKGRSVETIQGPEVSLAEVGTNNSEVIATSLNSSTSSKNVDNDDNSDDGDEIRMLSFGSNGWSLTADTSQSSFVLCHY